ncbi:DUF2268 domain-containing putative Zn-dependent protease [Paracoccus aerodenitrificans]|uniref:DUF2268 domain-containing putative Zn-dependent protease n=1 Tax=Paracoccus aerodenitrificans TaxID=3017781 RepID=UPI0022F0DB46|nr:DUF2268 domain-containing putative Zn-dependent protease [Paracoccus aerodenitrificans]WBU64054.1 DUF2268 domain-containing putative Zn-dependent protease [Paracoccus aerodenitrificans]
MSVCNIHFLNARHGLTGVMPEIRAAAREAIAVASEHVDLPDVDLTIRAGSGDAVISGWGVGGFAPAPGEIQLTVDPQKFGPDALIRILVHELHHLIRWDGPGYGKSLGEAMVTEGLAGHFVLQILGGKPDPWDAVTPAPGLTRRAMNEWSRLGYDHAEWFFGTGKTIRRWSGYGLGHRLVAQYLSDNPGEDAITLATAPADRFRGTMRILSKEDAGSEDDTGPDPAIETKPDPEQPASDAE